MTGNPGKNKKKIPQLVFIDLKSAFNTVNWQFLVVRMRRYRILNFVTNTIEQLYAKSHTSTTDQKSSVKVRKGVLYSGILSPLLFDIYIEDLTIYLES